MGGSLAFPIIHISAQLQVFKLNQIMTMVQIWVVKLDVDADESI